MEIRLGTASNITVTPCREGVPEEIAARAFYKRAGFAEDAPTGEFESPVQKFSLKR